MANSKAPYSLWKEHAIKSSWLWSNLVIILGVQPKIVNALIASSSALFVATTGFSYTDLVTWAGSVITTVLGGGLGLVNAMLGWIIALAIIGVVIGLIYHALRFLHILR